MHQSKTVTINTIQEEELLKANPRLLMKMLDATEFEILSALSKSSHGLTVRGIQNVIAILKLHRLGFSQSDIQKAGITPVGNTAIGSKYVLDLQPSENNIRLARSLKLEIPSNTTINRVVGGLVAQGFAGKRELPKNKRSEFVYFMNLRLQEIIPNFSDYLDLKKTGKDA